MRIKFKNLMLEITRQCGMNCNHCMRGEAEDVDMKYDVIYTICEKTTHIEQLSITGGEPSLAPEKIDLLANRLSYNGCTIGSFFCATNAQHYSESFVAALNLLYKQSENPEKCILSISTDQFHSGADPKALEEYRKLPYYSPVKEKGYLPPHKILNEGRAADNGIGTFDALYDQEFYDVEFKGFDLIVNDRVYINVFGDILLEPDARYSAQNEISVGNLLNESLTDIILSNTFKIPDHWIDASKQSVYCVKMTADPGIILNEPFEHQLYYAYARLASVAFHSVYHNLQLTPINPELGVPPTGLKITTEWLKETGLRCIGNTLHYHFPDNTTKTATIEVIRCPIEEGFDDVRE